MANFYYSSFYESPLSVRRVVTIALKQRAYHSQF